MSVVDLKTMISFVRWFAFFEIYEVKNKRKLLSLNLLLLGLQRMT